MENNGIASVSVDIDAQIFCDFQAVKLEETKGIVFVQIDDEKKIQKNGLLIGYYKEKGIILLRIAGMCLSFQVLSGDRNDFKGEYKLSFFGKEGVVIIK